MSHYFKVLFLHLFPYDTLILSQEPKFIFSQMCSRKCGWKFHCFITLLSVKTCKTFETYPQSVHQTHSKFMQTNSLNFYCLVLRMYLKELIKIPHSSVCIPMFEHQRQVLAQCQNIYNFANT